MGRVQTLGAGPLVLVVGELLLVVCSACYLVWWSVTYRPAGRAPFHGGPFLAGAVLAGLGGIVLLGVGIAVLLPRASGLAVAATVVGGVLVGALLIHVTSTYAHRPVTTELPLIVLWTTAQVAAGVALRSAGMLDRPAALFWFAATAIAALVGLACYLVFYRLAPVPAYWVGMLPLAFDGVVAALLAAVVALTRAT
ncbi:hypothetical protein [Microlunatus flavus]|uniref:Uncharacterized protein n=1 Tax=Microlunatus flavus TaxID=1036181 RepID=A0A1H9FPA1_9ACTN|nr:hypothetical protein [Microlunatus flavus]SEQ39705.1 hypothetical protein SAMN05421756_103336 [Microlunatus flavus]